jgi:hypothetical protein
MELWLRRERVGFNEWNVYIYRSIEGDDTGQLASNKEVLLPF